MRWLTNLSIRTRLTVIVAGSAMLCLLVGFAVIGWRHVETLKTERLHTAATLAEVVADYSVTSLAFGDVDDANDALARLSAFSEVEAAGLYDEHGKLFATYLAGGTELQPPTELVSGVSSESLQQAHIELVRPIVYRGRTYGAIFLRMSAAGVRGEIRTALTILAALVAGLLVLALVAARLLQRTISKPLLELARAAEQISASEDSKVRVAETGGGELRVLSVGFNAMLDRLDSRQRALEESHRTIHALIDASPLGIIGLGADHRINLWNPQAQNLFELAEADAVGRAPEDVLDSHVAATIARCLHGEISDAQLRLVRKNGTPLELRFFGATVRPSHDETGGVVIVSDETERKLTEAALVERDHQLQRAQKLEVVGRLAGGVSHDFNNVLTVVLASCSQLKRRLAGQEALVTYLDLMLEAAQRGAALATRLLMFAKQRSVEVARVDLNELVSNLDRMVRTVVGESITVTLEVADKPAFALVDTGQLEQLLLNLVINARDAMPRGGRITTRVATFTVLDDGSDRFPVGPGKWTTISVADTGTGMTDEVVAKIFQPFFTTKHHGTGLGLATGRQLIKELGGELTVDTEIDRGTTFTVWLPQVARGGVTPSTDDKVLPPRGSETILLVEDQADLRLLARDILVGHGYRVLDADCAANAITIAKKHALDLLLTDVVMPGMSGAELARALTALRPGVPVLYMSGYVGDHLAVHGVDDVSAPLIRKPFTSQALLAKVHDALAAARRTRATALVEPRRGSTRDDR